MLFVNLHHQLRFPFGRQHHQHLARLNRITRLHIVCNQGASHRGLYFAVGEPCSGQFCACLGL